MLLVDGVDKVYHVIKLVVMINHFYIANSFLNNIIMCTEVCVPVTEIRFS
jgi:hypothetical protein